MLGLVFGFVGDLLLVFLNNQLAFMLGLVAFLLGHLFYVAAFWHLRVLTMPSIFSGIFKHDAILGAAIIVVIIGSYIIYHKFYPYLGELRIPVLVYTIVISIMVIGAFFVVHADPSDNRRWIILLGATLFFISDIFVARQKFYGPSTFNAVMNLPIYYLAQFLLAYGINHTI